MALAPYETLANLKLSLGIPTGDVQDDTLLNAALVRASDRVDQHCGREGTGFSLEATATARLFTATAADVLIVDDIGSMSGLAVGTGPAAGPWPTVPVDQWEVRPLNALVKGRAIEVLYHHYSLWPVSWPGQRVQVTARWGWPAVPTAVVTATLLEAAKLFRRKDSPDGIAGSSDSGAIRVSRLPLDPDAASYLDGYQKPGFA